jgi:DNA-binding CsgD family transcriptional regulator
VRYRQPDRVPTLAVSERRSEIIGRAAELLTGDRFLDALAVGPARLLLEGEPGIGKTTIWAEICARARTRGYTVLATRPVGSGTELPFAGLLDLLGDHLGLLTRLPDPQRRALEIALVRADPDPSESIGALATSAGFLSLLSLLSDGAAVLVAIDDLQWLDAPSSRVVGFGVRRLDALRVGLLGAVRVPSALDPTVPLVDLGVEADRLRLGPMSVASLYHLIDERLGVSLPRHDLLRIDAASGGNAIVALEIARAWVRDPETRHDVLPIPDTLSGLVSRRVGSLPEMSRRAMLISAALARPTTDLVGARNLQAAEDAGFLNIDANGRVRFAHPLFATAVYASASAKQRANVHDWLSQRVPDPDERTLHAALASTRRDGELAARLHDAAERARIRGAPEVAADLEERAAARTPLDEPEAGLERTLRAAEHHERAGDVEQATSLAESVIAASASPALRARAKWLIAEIAFGQDFAAAAVLLEQAIREPGADRATLAVLELHLAFARMVMMDLAAALPHAWRAERLAAAGTDRALLAEAIGMRVYIEATKYDRLDTESLRQALDDEDPYRQSPIQNRPRLNAAVIDALHGRLGPARGALLDLRRSILESGEEHELPFVLTLLAFTELLGGDIELARRYVDEALHSATMVGSETLRGYAIGIRCMIASFAGDADAVQADTEMASTIFQRVGSGIGPWYVVKGRAFLALSGDRPDEVEAQLGPASAGAGSSFAYAAAAFFLEDLIEARLATGNLDTAATLISGILAGGRSVDSPMALVIGGRGRALLESARGRTDLALRFIDDAIREGARLAVPLERGRVLLAKGQILRRARRKQAAHEAITAARVLFQDAGTPRWVAKADAELARIGLRRGARLELTETERRIALLAASGLTNREIGSQAFVSPKTVEDVLSRVYGKLGIRSRAELGATMSRDDAVFRNSSG